jgi:Domain of unknown function (DUF932)
MTMNQTITQLSLDQIKQAAPAAFATKPADYITSKYNFVPTTDVIEKMGQNGWVVTSAQQSKTKVPLRFNYGTHILRFQNPEYYVKGQDGIEGRPEVVFINSHDGSRPLQSELGLFRLVCSNGLVIKTQDFGGFRERHTKLTNDAVKHLLDEKTRLMESVIGKINRWNQVQMKQVDMRQFATDALIMRLGEERKPEDHEVFSVLEARRDADKSNTLWHVFNRVQENLIKGGFDIGNRRARAITNPTQDLKLNQGLWQLAEEFVPMS